MVKKPGLPGGELQLDVDEGALGAPAHVEDYLDRAYSSSPAPRPAAQQPPTPQQVVRRAAPPVSPEPKRAEPKRAPEAKVVELERPRAPRPAQDRRPAPRRAERKEISIDAETVRMIDRVVGDLRESTPQKDTSASEFVRAIIQLAEESRHHQDFTHVSRRGQWGGPTARAFVADLKEGFLRAIGRHFIDRYSQDAAAYLREVQGDEPL